MPRACWKWDRRVRDEDQPELHKELEINRGYLRPCLKNLKKGHEDCSVSKDSCHQPWRAEFNPWHPHGGRGTLIPADCPLTFTHLPVVYVWRNGYFTRKLWLVALCVFVLVYTCVCIWKPEAEVERLPCSFSNLSMRRSFIEPGLLHRGAASSFSLRIYIFMWMFWPHVCLYTTRMQCPWGSEPLRAGVACVASDHVGPGTWDLCNSNKCS